MSYKITITETKLVTKTVGKDWEVIGEKVSDMKLPDNAPRVKMDIMGYTPEIRKKVEVEVELLRQTVETLDLVKVIKAINGI